MGTDASIVAIRPCETYDYEIVRNSVSAVIEHLNPSKTLFSDGQRIHIKPNMLSAKQPERAATTHPSVIKAVIEYVQQYDVVTTIGDSPAAIAKPIEHYWEMTGFQQVANETGAQLVPLEKRGVVEKKVNGRNYFIAQAVAEADVVINVCKLKTHGLTLMTGAIKNMFGAIPGVQKGEFHKLAPKVQEFSKILVDVYQAVSPQLNIMDAVEIMEGNGPSTGNPRSLGYLIGSLDGIALDSIAAHLLGFKADEILTSVEGAERNLGINNLENIIVDGMELQNWQPSEIELPSNRILNYIPENLIKLVAKLVWIRPRANKDSCKRCGVCIKNCPVQAMESEAGFPVINYETCIKCFCCDESCPHQAIQQESSWLARKLR